MKEFRLVLAALALLGCGACKVDVDVSIAAHNDGSGRVTATVILDEEAARELRDSDTNLRLDDVRKAGWRVKGPDVVDSTRQTRIQATKDFESPRELPKLLRELGGDGLFSNPHLTVDRSLAQTRTSFDTTLDLSRGIDTFTDDELRGLLGGEGLGLDRADLERRIGARIEDAVDIRAAASIPGAPTVSVSPRLGERKALRASAQRWNVEVLIPLAVAVASALALVGLFVSRRIRLAGARHRHRGR